MRYSNDIELFEAFRSGEQEAANVLFLEHFKPLCFFAEKITGIRQEAEDIVADSFIKMLHKRPSFENLTNVKAFLYVTTRNASINFIRSDRRHKAAHWQVQYLIKNENGQEDMIEEEMIRAEVLAEIRQEIENLPDKCREIFKLIFFEGLSTEMIAKQLGIAEQTVRSQKSRAIQLIKIQLLSQGKPAAVLFFLLCLGNLP